jgi:thiamine-phosphate pyrophosphorylase
VEFVQIREKFTPTNELMDLCREVMQLPRQRLQKIIMNDRLDIALAFGLDGVHLGGNSFPVLEVRRNTPKTFIIGVSIHHWKEAVMAEREGANYAVFGPIYPTPSKLGYGPPQGIEKLREVVQMVSIPILAIGGISLGNYRECLNAGAAGIAAISLFQDSRTVKRVVEKIRTGK